MDLNALIIILLTIGVSAGVPLYVIFRNKMVRKDPHPSDFSKRRVFRLTITNITLNTLVSSSLLLIFLNIISQSGSLNIFTASLSLLFLGSSGATFYGNGMYITSIILESYTLPQLKRISQFKTQFIATHLFHGPISHVLIYSGWPMAMFFLSLLEGQLQNGITAIPLPLLAICGIVAGSAYSMGQIYNGSYPYQMLTNLTIATFLSISSWTRFLPPGPLSVFMLLFSLCSFAILFAYLIKKIGLREEIDWNISPEPL